MRARVREVDARSDGFILRVRAGVCVRARVRLEDLGQVAGCGKVLARPRLPVFTLLLPFSSGLSWTSSTLAHRLSTISGRPGEHIQPSVKKLFPLFYKEKHAIEQEK